MEDDFFTKLTMCGHYEDEPHGGLDEVIRGLLRLYLAAVSQ